MGAWDNLSIKEKADMMKAAIRNGITTLPEIKQAYNEFAEGGNIYGGGGQKKSGGSFYQTHRARWFNFLRKKGVDPVKAERLATYFSAQDSLESGHGTSDAARRKNNYGGMQRLDKKTNKMVNVSYGSIDDYMNAKWKMMNSKYSRALNAKSVQEYANILNDPKYHGKAYMYGLYKGYRDGQPLDVARQTKYMNDYTRIMMDIAGEKGFKGADVPDDLSIVQPENPYTQFIPFEPFNPQVFNSPQAFVAPTREQFEAEQPIVEAAKDYAYSPEQLEKEERRQGLNNLSFILGMMNGGNGNSFADTIGILTGNIAAKGGPIHIKPENRGKFTRLKERTGHSATWFKEHGTPAQKKMATFALNARHWKHGYGGHIYDGTTEDSQQMNIPYAGELPDVTVIPRRIANKAWDKIQERWVGDMPTYYAVNPETGKEEMLREIGNGKYSTYDDKHVFDVLGAEAAKKQREQWIKNGGNASDFDKVMLGTLGLGLAPIALPEIAAGVTAASDVVADAVAATPWGQTAIKALNTPFGKTAINTLLAYPGLNNFFSSEGYQKTANAFNEGRYGDAALSAVGDALDLSMAAPLAKNVFTAGDYISDAIKNLYRNYPIRNYNIDAIIKSDFYNEVSKQYGKDFADDLAQRLTSKEFRKYLFGDNPRKAYKAGEKHLEQMEFIDDVENAGGLLGGSGQLARKGTVKREGLLHDLDFFVPGSMEERSSSVIDALGLNKHNKPNLGVLTPTGVKPKVWNNVRGSIEEGYINLPQERGNITADMFIRSEMPTDKESADVILNAKRQFGRPKDLADIENFVPYSKENPIIDIATGEGQWNPTLFDRGIFTEEGYPFIQSIETYPGSGVRVPAVMNYKGQIKALSNPTVSRIPQITAENAAGMTPEQLDAAYKAAVESGNRPEALRLLEQAYLKSGIPLTDITVTPEGHAVGWYHGSEWGNHTIFDSSAMNATIGGTSAHGKIKGNFLTTDVPSAMRYAGSSRYSSANVPEYTSPQTFNERIKNLFGMYKSRKLYPAERVGDYAPKPERMFDTKGKPAIDHLDKVDNVVYPLYVNPGEDIMRLDFQGKPWSQSPVEFPNNFYLRRHIRDDIAKTYRDEIVPYKDYETAYKAWIEDPINTRHGSTSLDGMHFDDGIRSIEGFNSAPRYEKVRLVEERVPNTTNGAVQTAAKEGKASVLMRNVIDSNGGPEGAHYAIDDFVTLKPNQQKLADITYDDSGNLIPLSQRFNWLKDDIRYGLLPFGIGLTGYGLYNSRK